MKLIHNLSILVVTIPEPLGAEQRSFNGEVSVFSENLMKFFCLKASSIDAAGNDDQVLKSFDAKSGKIVSFYELQLTQAFQLDKLMERLKYLLKFAQSLQGACQKDGSSS